MEKTLSEIFKEGYRFDETILAASENKRLFFFLGAGVSRLMGTMGWDSLARELVKKVFPSYNKQNSILNGISNNKELITIAHEEFLNKTKRGDAETPDGRFNKSFDEGNTNDIYDDIMLKYVPEIKARLEKKGLLTR